MGLAGFCVRVAGTRYPRDVLVNFAGEGLDEEVAELTAVPPLGASADGPRARCCFVAPPPEPRLMPIAATTPIVASASKTRTRPPLTDSSISPFCNKYK